MNQVVSATAWTRLALGRFEKILIGVSLIVFFQALFLYVTDYPLIRALFVSNEGAQGAIIGLLVKKSGSTVRQLANESDFRAIDASSPVYNMDLLVTGSDAEAYVQFQAGGFVRIGPDSMVRLSFAPELAVGGVIRLENLEVVAGQVYGYAGNQKLVVKTKGEVTTIRASMVQGMEVVLPASTPNLQAARLVRMIEPTAMPPSNFKPLSAAEFKAMKIAALEKVPFNTKALPDPSAFIASLVLPKHPIVAAVQPQVIAAAGVGPRNAVARLLRAPKVDTSGTLISADNIVKKVSFSWLVQPSKQSLEILVLKDGVSRPVLKKIVQAKGGQGVLQWLGTSPGKYHWEIRDDQSQLLKTDAHTKGEFFLSKDLTVTGAVVAQVAGTKSASNKGHPTKSTQFKIDLDWSKIPGVREYEVVIAKSLAHPLLVKKVRLPHYEFNRGKMLLGDMIYQVSGFLDNGFIVHLPSLVFGFKFLPPVLSVPENNAILSKEEIVTKDQDNLMLIWEGTLFTQGYQVEVSRDAQFTRTFLKRDTKENYVMMLKPVLGNYWWRVRSKGDGVESPPSAPSHYVIGP